MIGTAVASAERKDDVKLSSALAKALEEDPSLRVAHVQDTGETVMEGQGEMHLRVALERLTGKYGIAIKTHEPAIPYKETIRAAHRRSAAATRSSPAATASSATSCSRSSRCRAARASQFKESITGGAVPRNYFRRSRRASPSISHKGRSASRWSTSASRSPTARTIRSTPPTWPSAPPAQIGMREGMPECKPVLLEPVLKVEMAVPSEATARVNAIVSQRRGQLLGFDARPGWQGWDVVEAMIPQAEIRDLIIELRSATAGVGSFKSSFDHLAELTGRLADQARERAASKAA